MDLLIKSPIEYEPLRNNRFLLRFPSDLGIQEWWVQDCGRPSLKQGNTKIEFLNTSNYVLGRYEWDPINITLREPIGPSATQAVMEWVRLGTESVTGRQGYAVSYKRDLILEQLDPTGTAVSQWIIKNAMLTDVNFSDMKYSDDGLATVSITIQPQYCILSF
jgi:hypothetical protein